MCDFSYIASILYVNCMHVRHKNFVKIRSTFGYYKCTVNVFFNDNSKLFSYDMKFLSILIIGIPKQDFSKAYSYAFANYLFILYFVILTEKQTFYLS